MRDAHCLILSNTLGEKQIENTSWGIALLKRALTACMLLTGRNGKLPMSKVAQVIICVLLSTHCFLCL